MELWAVVDVPFYDWPVILELHEHKTRAAARAHAIAGNGHVNDSGYVACIPIETGERVLGCLGKLYRKWLTDLDGVTAFQWRIDK